MTLEGEWKYHMTDVEPLIVGQNKSQKLKRLFYSVMSKKVGYFFQILVALSENIDCIVQIYASN